jgi:alpha-tubulin suppressor-like RCC1 family protein
MMRVVTRLWFLKACAAAALVAFTSGSLRETASAQAGSPAGELTGITAVAGGRGHTCAIGSGGQVFCWGNNEFGQLGDGTTTRRLHPVAVKGLTGATAIRIGGDHSCAIVAKGEVRCWGSNTSGQLGDGTTTNRPTPAPVQGLTGVTAIAVGRVHGCALVSGELRCWGGNMRGQIGDGTTTQRPAPVAIKGLPPITAVEAGDAFHTCALAATGSTFCWGWNQYGQSGGGKQNDPFDQNRSIHTPTAIEGVANAIAISVAGAGNSCALIRGGQVRCWGWNNFGQLGNGITPLGNMTSPERPHSATPVTVQGLSAVAITGASGTGHVCAITSDRRVQCWGHNGLGQRGDGRHVHLAAPSTVPGVSDVTVVTGGADHTCAIISGGRVRCWGYNNEGQLGDGTTTARPTPVPVLLADNVHVPRPVQVAGLTGATMVVAGTDHSCAVVAEGRVRCWGSNARSQLGNGSTTSSASPVDVRGLSGVTAIAAGGDHTCAVAGGQLSCWGWNGFGQLGDGTVVDRPSPIVVKEIAGATAVAAGRQHTCAIVAGGEVRCWGHNFVGGPLGVRGGSQGGALAHPLPVAVQGLTGATSISVRGGHTCVNRDGEVRCWGFGTAGQMGTAKPSAGPTPVTAEGVAGVTAVAAGLDHTCALVAGGAVRCWGVNAFGQVGDGTTTDRTTQVAVQGITGASAIAAGEDHSCALTPDGRVSCWGWNEAGQLGNGTTVDSSKPVTVEGLPRAIAVAAGWEHTCAIVAGGSVYCWGHNKYSQLGVLNR